MGWLPEILSPKPKAQRAKVNQIYFSSCPFFIFIFSELKKKGKKDAKNTIHLLNPFLVAVYIRPKSLYNAVHNCGAYWLFSLAGNKALLSPCSGA